MKSTTRFEKNKKGLECLNCGAPLNGNENFCPECGQVNDVSPLSVKQFFSEFFAGFFSFDSRFFNTIIPLLFKPGKVSKEYIKGRRKRYTNPFKLYLHTSIVFFLLNGLIGLITDFNELEQNQKTDNEPLVVKPKETPTDKSRDNFKIKYYSMLDSIFESSNHHKQFNNPSVSVTVKDSLYNELYKSGVSLIATDVAVEGDLNKILLNEIGNTVVTKELATYFRENNIQYELNRNLHPKNFPVISDESFGSVLGKFIDFSKKNKDLTPDKALDSLHIEKTKANLFKYQKAQDLNKLMTSDSYRKIYFDAILSKIPIALFVLLPLFALFFSFLYIRSPYSFTEHLVVVFNLQTVFFLFLIIGLLIDSIFKTDVFIGLIFPLLFIFYSYKTLRNFYQQGRFKTIVKFIMLSVIYLFFALIGVMVVSFLAFLL